MTFNLVPLREILDRHTEDLDPAPTAKFQAELLDATVAGVQEWLRQPDIVAVMYEGLIESGTQLLTGAQLALIREAGRK